jgi:hypothetical protein
MRYCTYRFAALSLLAALLLPAPSQALPPPCLDVNVEYLGRTLVANIGGVDYYRWCYRVTGQGCLNRGLSHITLELCQDFWDDVLEYSTQTADESDMPNGTTTDYVIEIGNDLTTGVGGIKWEFSGGNPLDLVGEYDTFCFVSTGEERIANWASKGGQAQDSGTTIGPSCQPVPVRPSTWSSLKARFRN